MRRTFQVGDSLSLLMRIAFFQYRYKKNVQDAAMLMQDVQMTGLEKAVWWTEYLIRHKDISFMKTNVHNFNSFQYYLLDVILFCVVVTAIGIYVQFKITKFCFRRIFRRNKVKSE